MPYLPISHISRRSQLPKKTKSDTFGHLLFRDLAQTND